MEVAGGLMGEMGQSFLPNNVYTFTFAYALFALCVVWPPRAIADSGLTIAGLLSPWLGNEGQHVVWFHMRRTVATVIVHALLPLLYLYALSTYSPHLFSFSLSLAHGLLPLLGSLLALAVCAGSLAAIGLALWWTTDGFSRHPIARMLLNYQSPHWQRVASAVEIEYRRVDKVVARLGHSTLAVTDSWILHFGLYSIAVVFQNDADLSIVGSKEAPLLGSIDTMQVLSIRITSVRAGIAPFVVRLDSAFYADMRLKVQATIRNSTNIVIRQTLSEQFAASFRAHAEHNPRFRVRDDHRGDTCAGCMQNVANVKLIRRCARSTCTECFCRPMWCIDCMAKWFASTQPQHSPERWMEGSANCPTCRAAFCINDVSLVD